DRRGDVNLNERDRPALVLFVNLAGGVAILAIWTDEAGDRDQPGVGEELGDLADAADVLLAIFSREAEAEALRRSFGIAASLEQRLRGGGEAEADVVAVQDVSGVAVVDQDLFERHGDRALAGAGQAGEPERATLLFQLLAAFGTGYRAVVPRDL